jgi:pyruvate dehydrogenase E2 component (dihydrolipoamide acetyltransferase)
VETDKVTMEVESFTSGTVLKLLCAPGDEITVGNVIALIGEPGEEVSGYGGTAAQGKEKEEAADARTETSAPPAPNTKERTPEPAPRSEAPPATGGGEVKATPLVKNFAAKRKVDLSRITGTGPQGLIVKADVVRYLESGAGETTEPERAAAGPEVAAAAPAALASAPGTVSAGPIPYTDREIGRNQQAIARNLTKSATEIPVYTVTSTVYTDPVTAARGKYPADTKPSLYAFYIYATARALEEYSGINGCFAEGVHRVYGNINVGFAVAHGGDLFVPVVRDANTKSIDQIAAEVRWLTAKVRNRKLEGEDILGGTFTVSNLGVYPVDEFTAIISPGQAGILAVGRSEKRVVVDDEDRMSIRESVRVTGSFDHRVVNGAEGAAFLESVKGALEKIRS